MDSAYLSGAHICTGMGGIIWGLWHAPLTCAGHNLGTDYPGFPYLGTVIMCICSGIVLTYLSFAILEIPVVILGIICFVLLCRDKEALTTH